jgi:hypothetical protein
MIQNAIFLWKAASLMRGVFPLYDLETVTLEKLRRQRLLSASSRAIACFASVWSGQKSSTRR